MKPVRKTRIDGHLKKEYGAAKTPFRRVLAFADDSKQQELMAFYKSSDPVLLR